MATKIRSPRLLLNESLPIDVLQPDYARWNAVTIGMSRQEVYELLGRPLRGPNGFFQPDYCHFGYLQFPLMPCIPAFKFRVDFYQDRVVSKLDPFDGVLSSNGKPTRAKIITPLEGSVFMHSPEVLDIRWDPVSGVYPMYYELDVRHGAMSSAPNVVELIPLPYHVYLFPSGTNGLLRVRGQNKLGAGDWSDFRRFEFKTPAR